MKYRNKIKPITQITKALTINLTALSIYFALMTPSYAYLDPGSGSVVVTTILGLIAAIGYTFRKYFYKLKRSFSKEKTTQTPNDSEKHDQH